MNKLVLLVLSLTSLVVAQQEQPHLNPRDLITPIAAIQPRATGLGDCQASFKLVSPFHTYLRNQISTQPAIHPLTQQTNI